MRKFIYDFMFGFFIGFLIVSIFFLLTSCADQTPMTSLPVCTVKQNSDGATISCPDGTTATVFDGIAGTDGTNGVNGINGTPGTSVTEVQFCPGTTTYPTQFNEIGFCIGGNLYAVYSANDGFLSLIPPGQYYSDGIGSSCNFTVAANCVVTH